MMIRNKLPKLFKEHFPKAAKVAEWHDADIKWRDKSFWLDGRVQLTGFEVNSDGKPMTIADNDESAARRLTQWADGLKRTKARKPMGTL